MRHSMTSPRSSGILLHPTSLPSRWGIGDLGQSIYTFIDFLVASGQQLWQVMPLGPTGFGDSPYQSFSAFAGNPLLISIDTLLEEGLLAPEDVADAPMFPNNTVDYGNVIPYKLKVLRRSFERFQASANPAQRQAFANFGATQHRWLNDYALFAALKDAHQGAPWNTWDSSIRRREPDAMLEWNQKLANEIQYHSYMQFLFFTQWATVKAYANERGISIIGDIPIFVAFDSADVWTNSSLFMLDSEGNPTVVAGVPPDYFSATGQRWGNPLYRWDMMARDNYSWWIDRVKSTFEIVDIVRIDHFRGFAANWEVPASEPTAINGRWVSGPGLALFERLTEVLGELPIIAEDLGVITPDVEELRDTMNYPGMSVLQFAFGADWTDPYLPHNHKPRSVVYTGTHDNDTTIGWWQKANDHERAHVQRYLGRDGSDISWDFIRMALASIAEMAVIPLQDLFNLDSSARMNMPGQAGGNWGWRYTPDMLNGFIAERLLGLTTLYGRKRP